MCMDFLPPPTSPCRPFDRPKKASHFPDAANLPKLKGHRDEALIVQFNSWVATFLYGILFSGSPSDARSPEISETLQSAGILMGETMAAMSIHVSSILLGLFFIARLTPEPSYDGEADNPEGAVIMVLLRAFIVGSMLADKSLKDGKQAVKLWFVISDMALDYPGLGIRRVSPQPDQMKNDRLTEFLGIERAALVALDYQTSIPPKRWQTWLDYLINHSTLSLGSAFRAGPVLAILKAALRFSKQAPLPMSSGANNPMSSPAPELLRTFHDKLAGSLQLDRCTSF